MDQVTQVEKRVAILEMRNNGRAGKIILEEARS